MKYNFFLSIFFCWKIDKSPLKTKLLTLYMFYKIKKKTLLKAIYKSFNVDVIYTYKEFLNFKAFILVYLHRKYSFTFRDLITYTCISMKCEVAFNLLPSSFIICFTLQILNSSFFDQYLRILLYIHVDRLCNFIFIPRYK